MYYYDKSEDIFRLNQKYDENGKGMYVEYTDAAYKALFDCDVFHYVAQDPVTKLPVQKENNARTDPDFWRRRREKKCFPLINRGQLWYDTLTEVQKEELRAWYKAWLDVTVTFAEPVPPAWLK